ncbi:peptidase S8/S53 subtilisin kexin sedolisin [Vineibacter terrae]|uniref:Peptidase S8/S53 subtilisin kexin sedolisin n=1 Tax=Vineibacter terrae TaxID=2586908 RepID=A0A5C8PPP9_9HYPH|nr:S8 family serine peptidase [Vineibacter terrae]TXL76806.1 peptidase S8/S53 subtilisin kexin sedolisin [Vineibacter terrae]
MAAKKKSTVKSAARRTRTPGSREGTPEAPAGASITSFWSDVLSSPTASTWLALAAKLANTPTMPAAAFALVSPPSSDRLGTRLSAIETLTTGESLKPMPWKVSTAMDPRLQLAVANAKSGKPGLALASTSGDEIAVIARVKSVSEWEALPDVVPGSTLGKTPDGSWIVTGRLPVRRAEAVRTDPVVLSLKASQPVHQALAATVQAMQVAPLPPQVRPDGARGVVVGIVDFGCDFMHRNFRKVDGSSRILTIWNQGAPALPSSPFGYGRRYDKPDIDAALKTSNPYQGLGYGPPHDPSGTHGTHVTDIAAGNGNGSGQPGVAHEADIIFVEAATSDIAWTGPKTLNQAFGDSVQLLEAVRFIFNEAGDRPCVCNLSLGTNGGPHDGTSLVEQGLDALAREKDNRAVVIAASNSQLDDIHTSGKVPRSGTHDIVIRQSQGGGSEFEMWYPGNRRLEVSLVTPDGTTFGPVQPGDNLPIGANDQIALFISSRLDDSNNHDNVIGIWLAEGLSGDDFTVRVRSLDDEAVDYHAWIERNDRAQASFANPVPTHTLGSISTGYETVVVGSYDAHKSALPLSNFSSSGPTRDGRNKPEVSAPGHAVVAAKSGTLDGVVRKSGTSMAAPAVTGLIALVLAEASRKGQSLSSGALRQKLLAHAAINPPAMAAGDWNSRYGSGRANGSSIP